MEYEGNATLLIQKKAKHLKKVLHKQILSVYAAGVETKFRIQP